VTNKKTTRLSELHALKVRVHNLEIALVAIASMVDEGIAKDNAMGPAQALFIANELAGGFMQPEMIHVRKLESAS
jgi:hypothetical protein